jgi:hypothetical protein
MSDRGVNVQRLQERVADLEAEVARLQEELTGKGLVQRVVDLHEALRRAVEALQRIDFLVKYSPKGTGYEFIRQWVQEALTFAKGVTEE